jgi:hypothetical protein
MIIPLKSVLTGGPCPPYGLTVRLYHLSAEHGRTFSKKKALIKLPVHFKYAYMPWGEAGESVSPLPAPPAPVPLVYGCFLRGRGQGVGKPYSFFINDYLSKGQGYIMEDSYNVM